MSRKANLASHELLVVFGQFNWQFVLSPKEDFLVAFGVPIQNPVYESVAMDWVVSNVAGHAKVATK